MFLCGAKGEREREEREGARGRKKRQHTKGLSRRLTNFDVVLVRAVGLASEGVNARKEARLVGVDLSGKEMEKALGRSPVVERVGRSRDLLDAR
jgi:hypothetical protein